jgi:hypothetical protein
VPNHDDLLIPTLDFAGVNKDGTIKLYARGYNCVNNDYTIIPIIVTEINTNGFEYHDDNHYFLPIILTNPVEELSQFDKKILDTNISLLNATADDHMSDRNAASKRNKVEIMVSSDPNMHSSKQYSCEDVSEAAEKSRLSAKKDLHITPIYKYDDKVSKLTSGTKDQKS